MTDVRLIWEAAQALLPLLGQIQMPALVAAIEATGMSGRPLGMLLHAWDFGGRPLTPAALAACSPYYTDAVFEARMIDLREHGFLSAVGERAYQLTEKGRDAAAKISDAGFMAFAGLRPLPEDDLVRLIAYFERLTRAARHNPLTPVCPCIADQVQPDAPHADSYLGWLAEYIGDLYRYKCDCHTTAFRSHGISGYAMEPYTYLWRENITTLAGLVARAGQERMGRGHSEADYSRFIDELGARGWLARTGDSFALTDEGQAVRDRIEAETETLFYGIWDTLSSDERGDLAGLIETISMKLEPT